MHRVVVVGCGLAGLFAANALRDAPGLKTIDDALELRGRIFGAFEMAVETVLPSCPKRLRQRAHRDLEELGVELRLGTRVVGVDATGLDVEGRRIEART